MPNSAPVDPAARRYQRAALFVILLVGASLALMWFARSEVAGDSGPSALAAGAGHVHVVSGGRLFRLANDGALLDAIDLKELGFRGTVNGLQVLGDGTLLAGDYERGNVYRCRIEARSCAPALEKGGARERLFHSVFHFETDEERGRIYVADTGVHRLHWFALDGAWQGTTRGDDPGFCYPNTVRLQPDGSLAIADTNNHRIAFVRADEEPGATVGQLLAADGPGHNRRCSDLSAGLMPGKGDRFLARELDYQPGTLPGPPPHGRHGRIWPMDLVRDAREQWWIINAGGNMRRGDVLRLDPQGRVLGRTALRDDATDDPLALLALPARVLIADAANARLYSADLDGRLRLDFGDSAFQSHLADLRARKRRAGYLYTASKLSLALAVIAAGVIAVLDARRRRSNRP